MPDPEPTSRPAHVSKDAMKNILAILTTAGFFGVMTFMLTYPIPETGKDVLLILIGALSASWTGILGFYFGSSLGSESKTAMLANRP